MKDHHLPLSPLDFRPEKFVRNLAFQKRLLSSGVEILRGRVKCPTKNTSLFEEVGKA